jgi:superfamily II DNA or RNA helicase
MQEFQRHRIGHSNPTHGPADTRHGSPKIGELVRARRQRWRVVDVRAFEKCRLLTLRGSGPGNSGAVGRFLSPFDRVDLIDAVPRVRVVRARTWRRRCRALLAEARPAGALKTAHLAQIDLMPHQLEPALALVRGSGSRVLVADDVGLGKTIQAGLILAELRALGAADRALVLSPAGLREQWAGELSRRFGMEAVVADASEMRRRTAELLVGQNPWSTIPLAVASVDYIKRPEVAPALLACRWDVVVVDEAHGVTPASDRYAAVSALASRAASVVLLTATPHNGNRPAFDALCSLGAAGGDPRDRLLVFRRTRLDVALGSGRRVHLVPVRSSSEELRMHERLAQFSRALLAERGSEPGAALALTVLHKRALSSARSLESSLVRLLSADPAQPAGHSQLALPLDDAGGDLDATDQEPSGVWPALDDREREHRMLSGIAEAARDAAACETKLRLLARLLGRLERRGERAIVFTEFRDTLLHVHAALSLPCAVIHGGLARDDRRAALDDFQSGRRRVLLATDAAGEGLNLHEACRVVVNLELPWNPMRLEQRIGRVDRIGQSRRVHVFNLVARDTGERRLLDRLQARVARARRDIGAANPLASSDAEDVVVELSAAEAAANEDLAARVRLEDLRGDAAMEYARLSHARILGHGSRESGRTNPSDSWIAFSRPSRRRSRLPHGLALLQSGAEDGDGRSAAAAVTALSIDFGGRLGRAEAVAHAATIARSVEAAALSAIERDAAEWSGESRRMHERFWLERLSRERSIAEALATVRTCGLQPGLFDRRAELAHAATLEERAALVNDATERIAAAERSARCEGLVQRLSLLLLA